MVTHRWTRWWLALRHGPAGREENPTKATHPFVRDPGPRLSGGPISVPADTTFAWDVFDI